MIRRFLALPLVAILAFAAGRADGQEKKKFAELDGTWTLIKAEMLGKSLLGKDQKTRTVIKDGKAISDSKGAGGKAVELSKFLDPSKKPKTITYAYQGTLTFYGIYEVKGDELRVCMAGMDAATEKDPEARRPREFDSNKGILLVFKREKK
jgi:uncharacterized protein (TIGR03067 family)